MVSTINKHLGEKLRQERLVRGFSMKVLADALGITHQQVQKYEKGINQISVEKVLDICRILKMPVSVFLSGLEKPCEDILQHERMAISVSKDFMKIKKPTNQVAISRLIKSMAEE